MVRDLLEEASVATRLLNNDWSRSVSVVDVTVDPGEIGHDLFDFIIAQRTDSSVYQSYSV